MAFGIEDIIMLEDLEKLSLNEEERERAIADMSRWIEMYDALKTVDTENTEPLVSVVNMNNVFREDVAVKAISRERLLENAPEANNGYFQVPRTI